MTSSGGKLAPQEIELLVDIGGGYGRLLANILKACPRNRGIILELEQAVVGVPALLAEAGVAERCRVVVGDMFSALPICADGYVLKSIIHDWDDQRSVAILRNIRQAITPGGRLMLIEQIVDDNNEPCWGKFVDLVVLTVAGGHERTEEEYRALFEQPGFRLTRTVGTSTGFYLIEGSPV